MRSFWISSQDGSYLTAVGILAVLVAVITSTLCGALLTTLLVVLHPLLQGPNVQLYSTVGTLLAWPLVIRPGLFAFRVTSSLLESKGYTVWKYE